MSKQKITYTATFSDNTTTTKATSAKSGFSFALQISFATGVKAFSFSATKAGVMKSLNEWKEFDAADMVGAAWEIVPVVKA